MSLTSTTTSEREIHEHGSRKEMLHFDQDNQYLLFESISFSIRYYDTKTCYSWPNPRFNPENVQSLKIKILGKPQSLYYLPPEVQDMIFEYCLFPSMYVDMDGYNNHYIDGALLAALRQDMTLYHRALNTLYKYQNVTCTRPRYAEVLCLNPKVLELVKYFEIQLNGNKQRRHDDFKWKLSNPYSKFSHLCNIVALTIDSLVGEPLIFTTLLRLMRQSSKTLRSITFIIKDAGNHPEARQKMLGAIDRLMYKSSPGEGARWLLEISLQGLHFSHLKINDIRDRWCLIPGKFADVLGTETFPVVRPKEGAMVGIP